MPSPLPALRAVNQLSSLFKAMLWRSLDSQNYVVTFSFPVCFFFFWGWKYHMSSVIRKQYLFWYCGHLGADSMFKRFQNDFCCPSQKQASSSFSWCCKQCFASIIGNFVKSLHPSPLPHVEQQGYLAGVVPLCEHRSNEREKGILHAVIHLLSSARTTYVV